MGCQRRGCGPTHSCPVVLAQGRSYDHLDGRFSKERIQAKLMALKQYDVLIIGSGHSGGMAAYVLARKGISCLMLNAGPSVNLERDRKPLPAHELPYRGLSEPGAIGDGAI